MQKFILKRTFLTGKWSLKGRILARFLTPFLEVLEPRLGKSKMTIFFHLRRQMKKLSILTKNRICLGSKPEFSHFCHFWDKISFSQPHAEFWFRRNQNLDPQNWDLRPEIKNSKEFLTFPAKSAEKYTGSSVRCPDLGHKMPFLGHFWPILPPKKGPVRALFGRIIPP